MKRKIAIPAVLALAAAAGFTVVKTGGGGEAAAADPASLHPAIAMAVDQEDRLAKCMSHHGHDYTVGVPVDAVGEAKAGVTEELGGAQQSGDAEVAARLESVLAQLTHLEATAEEHEQHSAKALAGMSEADREAYDSALHGCMSEENQHTDEALDDHLNLFDGDRRVRLDELDTYLAEQPEMQQAVRDESACFAASQEFPAKSRQAFGAQYMDWAPDAPIVDEARDSRIEATYERCTSIVDNAQQEIMARLSGNHNNGTTDN